MDPSSINPSFGVVDSSGGLAADSSDTSETSLVHKLSASLPLSASIHVDRPSSYTLSPQTARKPNSSVFAEQIRQLEIEGHKLRSATVSALSQGTSSSLGSPEIKQVTSPLTSSLASLVDISAEQKTIADLRVQLDNQRRETERLQSHLLADSSSARQSYSNGPFSFSSKAAFSTVPASEFSSSHVAARRAFECAHHPSHMERALKESQEQVVELRKKLQDATESVEQLKRQFRAQNEELKSKLHETIVNRDTVLDLRQKESSSQEKLVDKLQMSLAHLQDKCRSQEQTLTEVNKQAESNNQSTYATTMALSQLRAVLASRELARGRPYLEGDPAGSSQSMAALVLTLERCLQEADGELDSRKQRASQLERELEEVKKNSYEKEQLLLKDHQERLQKETEDALRKVNSVTVDLEKRMEEANERASNARKQTGTLQEQLHVLEEQQQQQGRMKNETIGELENKLKQLKQDYADDYSRWQERRQALETSLDDVQRELVQVKGERSEAVRSQAATDTKAEDLQLLVNRLEGDLDTERERVRAQREREEELRVKVLSQEGQITHKQQEVERLQRMLEVVKQEASLQMHDRVASTEKQERDRYVDQISTLSGQLTSANEKKTQLSVENERLRMDVELLRQQVNDLRLDCQAAQTQTSGARSERELTMKQIDEERGAGERLRQECERYRRSAEERVEEVATLRSAVERATLQLEEKERVLSTIKQQSTSISQLMDVNTRTSDNMREERERLSQLVESKASALEEAKASQEAMGKKMRLREKRIKDLEDERVKLVEELGVKSQELALALQEKEALFGELRDSRAEVSRVTHTKDQLRRDLSRLKTSHAKELDKLHKRLRETERESKLTHKALKSKDSVDCKAVKVADQIQKEITAKRSEVDNLRSKARRLEEKMETLTKEKLMVERDKDSLKASLARSLVHTSQLTEELEASQALNTRLHRRCKDLDDALEKEAIKSASTQAHLEQFDQEVATLKLRHQLDLKEATQLSQNKVPKVSWVPVKDNNRSGTGAGTREEKGALEQNRKNKNSKSGALVPKSGRLLHKKGFSLAHQQQTQEALDLEPEAGKELKVLLEEMRTLIHGQREINQHSSQTPPPTRGHARPSRRRSRSSSMDKGQRNISQTTDVDASLAMSFPLRSADVSAFSAATGSRSTPPSPRRAAAATGSSMAGWSPEANLRGSSSQSDITDFSTSFSSPLLGNEGGAITMVPDTQELCRRLEEKIANLTRMGSNLQYENQEMAQLISAQGHKLETVKRNERHMSDNRR